ncbi:MAG: aspartate aminotransferase family protein [Rectinemataceae bacterium]
MDRKESIEAFATHVSRWKAAFFMKYGMDFVMGSRGGTRLRDLDGRNELINLHSNGGVFNLGHRNPAIISVMKKALDELDIGNHHLMSAERAGLAKALAETLPKGLGKTVFGVGGGEAIDLSIKLARAHTRRAKVVSFVGAYHGHTGYALAAGDEKYRMPFGPQPGGFVQVPHHDLAVLEAAVDADTAAVIMETVPATLGMPIPSIEFMEGAAGLCRKHGALLIMDEVQTGLGRTGRFWGFEHFGIVPDIVVTGKGLSGGIYPISATMFRDELEEVFHDDPFIHISTFGGSELGCRVAMEVLRISRKPDFLAHVTSLSDAFAQRAGELAARSHGYLRGLRRLGLMMGLEFGDEDDGPLMTRTSYGAGLLMIYANNDKRILQCLPPLVMEETELDEVFGRLEAAIGKARLLKPGLALAAKAAGHFGKKGK